MFTNVHYNSEGKAVSVTAALPGVHTPLVATASNMHFTELVEAVTSGGASAQDIHSLFFPAERVGRGFAQVARSMLGLSDRNIANGVRVGNDGTVTLHGDPVPPALSRAILRYWKDGSGDDLRPLVRFLRKVTENVSDEVQEQLFAWLDHQQFSIASDGDILGYKYVRSDLHSVHEGYEDVRVNGVVHRGHIPHDIGAVVEMDRADVDANPNVACSTGLHVGTRDYVQGVGEVHLLVKVDPADVVSVPRDHSDQKMRCCKYEVVQVTNFESARMRFDTEPEPEPEATAAPEASTAADGLVGPTLTDGNVGPTFVIDKPHPHLAGQVGVTPRGWVSDIVVAQAALEREFNEMYVREVERLAGEAGWSVRWVAPGGHDWSMAPLAADIVEQALRGLAEQFGGQYDVEDEVEDEDEDL